MFIEKWRNKPYEYIPMTNYNRIVPKDIQNYTINLYTQNYCVKNFNFTARVIKLRKAHILEFDGSA